MAIWDFFKRRKKTDQSEILFQDAQRSVKKDKIKVIEPTGFQINPSLLKLYKIYRTDSLVKQIVSLYTELQLQNGFVIQSSDQKVNEAIQRRLNEIEVNSNSTLYELIRDAFKHFVAFGNQIYIFQRKAGKTSGKQYKYNNQTLEPISSIFVQHPLSIAIERNSFGEVVNYKQDLTLLMNPQISTIFVSDPEFNVTKSTFSSSQRVFPKYNVAHIQYDYDIVTGFGRPFYFEVIDDILMLRKLEMIMEQLVSEGKLMIAMYNVGNNNFPTKSQKEITQTSQMLNETDPYGIIVQPHNHSVQIAQTSVLEQILGFYDRIRHRVYGALGLSAIMLGEAGQANRATAEVSINTGLARQRELQRQFAAQFQHEVLEHLLLDLGFDPRKLGDAMPKLMFNDPDLDYMIKLRTHYTYLYEHSVITQTEVRTLLGLNPTVDQEDMYIYRVKIPTLLLSAPSQKSTQPEKGQETENLLNPQNQHSESNEKSD